MPIFAQIDPDVLKDKAENAFGFLTGFFAATSIHLRDQLGLYAAMRESGPVTATISRARPVTRSVGFASG